MIKVKRGVKLAGLRGEILFAILVAAGVYDKRGVDLVVTSANDSKHGRGSLHYALLAVDLRTRTLPVAERPKVRDEIAGALGAEYDVVLEDDHLHIEFQPK